MNQPSLNFGGERARARSTDPGTSHAAARSLAPEDLRESQRWVFECFRAMPRMTDGQLAVQYSYVAARGAPRISISGLRTRRSELVAKGFLRDSGKREKTVSGRATIVWEVVP